MNSICPMNFFRTADATDTTIWKPCFKLPNVVVSLRCFAGNAKQICQNDKTERTRGRAMRAETVVSSLNKQISDVLVSVVIA